MAPWPQKEAGAERVIRIEPGPGTGDVRVETDAGNVYVTDRTPWAYRTGESKAVLVDGHVRPRRE